jgi:ribonuclease HII
MSLTAGVDEVGRGPLAGPVIAVAVIIKPRQILGLKRNELSAVIRQKAIAWAYGVASVIEIDKINILQASLLAMQRAVNNLSVRPDKVLVDGNKCPTLDIPSEAIIGGDDSVVQISAASIVAKVIRDYLMTVLDKRYPEYGFAKHKGYGTQDHMLALQQYGATPIHRRSFAPVREVIESI